LLVCLTLSKISYYSVEWGIRKLAPPVAAAIEVHRIPQSVSETKRDKGQR
jgi:hypothetical protein